MSDLIKSLASAWLHCKQAEAAATQARRIIEDEMLKAFNVQPDLEGTKSEKVGDYTIKMVGRIDRKVDAERLQELAAEAGLTDSLFDLFRWTPEINMRAWRAADDAITRPLSGAITAKPGRPSFSVSNTTLE